MPVDAVNAAPRRSMFVTVLSWGTMGVSSLGLLMCLLFAMVFSVMPFGELVEKSQAQAKARGQALPPIPDWNLWLFNHGSWIFFTGAALALLHLCAGLWLIGRHGWARIMMCGLLALDVLLALGQLGVRVFTFGAGREAMKATPWPTNMPREALSLIDTWSLLFDIAGVIGSILLAAAFAWLLKTLASAKTASEFH